jgi:hypothetical protein
MVKAICRAAAPGRVAMFVAILTIAILARLGGVLREGDQWVASDSQAMISVVLLWLVLPVFITMLAAALLRGEYAPLSWGLARPISRLRLLGSLVVLDALTIAACVLAAWVVLHGFGSTWGVLGSSPGALLGGLTFAYANLYFLTAIAGSRTESAVRAGTLAVLFMAGWSTASASLLEFLFDNTFGTFAHQVYWGYDDHVFGLSNWSGPLAFGEPYTWWLLAALVVLATAVAAPVLMFVRTARFAPGPVVLRPVAALVATSIGFAALLVGAGWACALVHDPPEAAAAHGSF